MKYNILYILLFISLFTLNAQEFGFTSVNGVPFFENVVKNGIVKCEIAVGKTYAVATNNYGVSTGTNESVTMKFAADLAIKLGENSSLTIDSYEQLTVPSVYPQQISCTDFNCNVSLLHGEAEIINNAAAIFTNNFFINTRLGCIVCGKGRFVVRSADNSSTFIVVDCTAVVMDNLGKRFYKMKRNDIISITPRPILSGKAGELMRHQNIVTSSELDESDCGVLSNEFATYDNEQHNYVFVTANTENTLVQLKR